MSGREEGLMSNPRYMPASDAARNRSQHGQAERALNITGYYVDNDELDTSKPLLHFASKFFETYTFETQIFSYVMFSMIADFTDLQTLFLACFATLVPLVLALITAFVVR